MPVHRVDRIVDEVRPHLVELGRVGVELGHVDAELPIDLDVVELDGQHRQGVVEPFVDVDSPDRGTIQLGVRPHGPDEL